MASSIFKLRSLFFKVIYFTLFFNAILSFSQQNSHTYAKQLKKWEQSSFKELSAFFEDDTKEVDLVAVQVIADLMLKQASKQKNPEYFITTHYLLASAYKRNGDYELALKSIHNAINHFYSKTSNGQKIRIHLMQASLLFNIGDYDMAMKINLKVLHLAKKEKDTHTQLLVNHNIAMMKHQMNNVRGALNIYNKNTIYLKNDVSLKSNKEKQLFFITTLIAMADACIDLEAFDNAIMYCNEVIRYSEIFGHYEYKAYGFLGLSNVYSLTARCQQAHSNLTKAAEMDTYLFDINFHSAVHLCRARTYFHQGFYLETIEELNKIKGHLGKNTSNFLDDHEISVLYAKSYQHLNDLAHASTYYNKAFDLFENNKKKIRTVNTSLTAEYDTEYLKEEIETWSSFAKKQKQKFQISTISALVLLFSFLIFNQKQKQKNRKKYEVLMESLNKQRVNKPSIVAANTHKKDSSIIETRKVRELLRKLKIFENEKWFIDSNSSLNEVAKKLKTNTSYLSKVINQYKKQSFSKYLTELRLNYAISKLKNDTKFRSYTVKSIAQEVGFHSAEPFAKAFKKKTGIYPSYFIRELDKI